MRLLTVTDSDIIDAVGFEADGMTSALEVVFKSSPDQVYRYEDVGITAFIKLITSESIGKTFHELFRKTKYPFTKSTRSPTLKK
jgi:hypothetical protein